MRKSIDLDFSDEKFKRLKMFTMHGATLLSLESGGQVKGDCPFCGKDGHFYVNHEKLLWDCKVCGTSGNQQTFLEKINERNKNEITQRHIQALAEDRGLPRDAFAWVELGWHGQYTIGVRGADGKLADLRIYKIGGKIISTAGVKTGLFGLSELVKAKGQRAFICEGEWDTVAMQWLLKTAGKPGRAVCSPGATVFKPDWASFFQGREVGVLYDNDEAGRKGELIVLDRLAKTARSLHFIHWPAGLPSGYDIRDHVVKIAVKRKKPKTCLAKILALTKPVPRSAEGEEAAAEMEQNKAPEVDSSVGIEDVFQSFEELLHQPSRMGIEMAIITSLAGVYKTDPVWMFLVAPPSSGKTAILNSLKYLSPPYDSQSLFVSHITTHSLISGMETKKGDPSIFAQLDGTDTALIVKDFTGVLSMRAQDKDDVYGQLRDAHDGYTSKSFGNGIKREYRNLRFSCLAGVTEAIYDEAANFQSLGERFGKLNIGRGNDVDYGRAAITKAFGTRDDFKVMEDRVAKLMHSCIKNLMKKAEEREYKLPKLSPELQKALVGISLYVGAMRGVVSRDKYKRDYIKSAPSSDMGIRNAKMLGAIAALRAAIYGRDEATLEDLPLVRKIALDTVNQRDEELLRKIHIMSEQVELGPNRARITESSRYTPYTIRCVMEDLVMLDILEKKKTGRRFNYDLSNRMKIIIKEAKLYEDPRDVNRQNPRIKIGRAPKGKGRHSRIKV